MPKHNPIHWLWSNVVHRKWRPGPSLDLDTRAIFPSWFYQTAGGIQKFQKVERESLIIDTLSKRGVQCWGRFLGHQKPASSRRMDISCRTSQINDGIGVWEWGILNSNTRKVSKREMRPKLGKMRGRPSIYPWVSPLILLYHTEAIFPWAKKLEDKPKIKEVLPQSRISWKSRRLDQANWRLRKCRPTKRSRVCHQTDRPDKLMTKSMSSVPRKLEKSRSSQGVSHD